MKCNNCGCDNPDDAKYCRVCGNVLQLESFFEKLSELGFMPTTMITLKGYSFIIFIRASFYYRLFDGYCRNC
jgi:hypothetical protein